MDSQTPQLASAPVVIQTKPVRKPLTIINPNTKKPIRTFVRRSSDTEEELQLKLTDLNLDNLNDLNDITETEEELQLNQSDLNLSDSNDLDDTNELEERVELIYPNLSDSDDSDELNDTNELEERVELIYPNLSDSDDLTESDKYPLDRAWMNKYHPEPKKDYQGRYTWEEALEDTYSRGDPNDNQDYFDDRYDSDESEGGMYGKFDDWEDYRDSVYN